MIRVSTFVMQVFVWVCFFKTNIGIYIFLIVQNYFDIEKVKKFVVWFILFPLSLVKRIDSFTSFKAAFNLRGSKSKGKAIKPSFIYQENITARFFIKIFAQINGKKLVSSRRRTVKQVQEGISLPQLCFFLLLHYLVENKIVFFRTKLC